MRRAALVGLRRLAGMPDDGQAMAEYVILVAFVIAATVTVFSVFPQTLDGYYRSVTGLIALPIP